VANRLATLSRRCEDPRIGSERRYWYEGGLDPVELEFQRLYGPVPPATRAEAKTFFGGLGLD
jgi:hypothetical protein